MRLKSALYQLLNFCVSGSRLSNKSHEKLHAGEMQLIIVVCDKLMGFLKGFVETYLKFSIPSPRIDRSNAVQLQLRHSL